MVLQGNIFVYIGDFVSCRDYLDCRDSFSEKVVDSYIPSDKESARCIIKTGNEKIYENAPYIALKSET